jgi:hypothetical protein
VDDAVPDGVRRDVGVDPLRPLGLVDERALEARRPGVDD